MYSFGETPGGMSLFRVLFGKGGGGQDRGSTSFCFTEHFRRQTGGPTDGPPVGTTDRTTPTETHGTDPQTKTSVIREQDTPLPTPPPPCRIPSRACTPTRAFRSGWRTVHVGRRPRLTAGGGGKGPVPVRPPVY